MFRYAHLQVWLDSWQGVHYQVFIQPMIYLKLFHRLNISFQVIASYFIFTDIVLLVISRYVFFMLNGFTLSAWSGFQFRTIAAPSQLFLAEPVIEILDID